MYWKWSLWHYGLDYTPYMTDHNRGKHVVFSADAVITYQSPNWCSNSQSLETSMPKIKHWVQICQFNPFITVE